MILEEEATNDDGVVQPPTYIAREAAWGFGMV